jgi:hypothetical protein
VEAVGESMTVDQGGVGGEDGRGGGAPLRVMVSSMWHWASRVSGGDNHRGHQGGGGQAGDADVETPHGPTGEGRRRGRAGRWAVSVRYGHNLCGHGALPVRTGMPYPDRASLIFHQSGR